MASEFRCVDGVWDGIDDDGVARLEIDRPDRMNALDGPASDRLVEVCAQWRSRSDVRVVILSGRGGAFCAGADVAGMASNAASSGGFDAETSRGIIESGSRLVGAIRDLPMPVVGAVDGAAVGIGASLAVAADLVYVTARSYFLLAFVNIGLMPDGGATALFAASVGRTRANAMALLGEKLFAVEAFDAGLINGVADDAEHLQGLVDGAVRRMLHSSPAALSMTKSALDAHALGGFHTAIAREVTGQTALLQSPAFQQALTAFAGEH